MNITTSLGTSVTRIYADRSAWASKAVNDLLCKGDPTSPDDQERFLMARAHLQLAQEARALAALPDAELASTMRRAQVSYAEYWEREADGLMFGD